MTPRRRRSGPGFRRVRPPPPTRPGSGSPTSARARCGSPTWRPARTTRSSGRAGSRGSAYGLAEFDVRREEISRAQGLPVREPDKRTLLVAGLNSAPVHRWSASADPANPARPAAEVALPGGGNPQRRRDAGAGRPGRQPCAAGLGPGQVPVPGRGKLGRRCPADRGGKPRPAADAPALGGPGPGQRHRGPAGGQRRPVGGHRARGPGPDQRRPDRLDNEHQAGPGGCWSRARKNSPRAARRHSRPRISRYGTSSTWTLTHPYFGERVGECRRPRSACGRTGPAGWPACAPASGVRNGRRAGGTTVIGHRSLAQDSVAPCG